MVREIIPKEANDTIKSDLLQECIGYGDIAEAQFWAEHYNVAMALWPEDLQQHMRERYSYRLYSNPNDLC